MAEVALPVSPMAQASGIKQFEPLTVDTEDVTDRTDSGVGSLQTTPTEVTPVSYMENKFEEENDSGAGGDAPVTTEADLQTKDAERVAAETETETAPIVTERAEAETVTEESEVTAAVEAVAESTAEPVTVEEIIPAAQAATVAAATSVADSVTVEASTAETAAVVELTAATETGNGPDEVLPASSLTSWDRDVPVKLRLGDTGVPANKPISIPTMLHNTVKRIPDNVALAHKRDGKWVKWTYKKYLDVVQQTAKAFIALGLEPSHGVGIVGFNSPEWFFSNIGAIFAGGLATGIYTTNSPEACHYVAESCWANIIVVENTVQLKKILKVWDRLPKLKAVVQYSGEVEEKRANVYTWEEFIAKGKDVPTETLQSRIRGLAPNKCSTLIYTSGTTGSPKGVMLSHDNITWTSQVVGRSAQLQFGEDHIISYLPLSHIAAQLVDMYGSITYGATVWFAQPDALKGSLATTLKEVRPTVFLGVPRVWEKFQEKLLEVGRRTTGLKKTLSTWAKDIGLRGNLSRMEGQLKGKKTRGSLPFGWTLANVLFRKIHSTMGFDRCKIFISAAAPIMRETLTYFMSLNIPVTEIYGMSESSGPHTVSFPWKFKLGSCGFDLPGCTTRLENPDEEGNGEICMGGRHVFMGYLGMEEKTKETVDEWGWLHTGDIGRVDEAGFLSITGRIKELLITAGGENVAPVPIEDSIKEECPIISNCMLIGDKRKFLSLLITLKSQVDSTMMPTDELTGAALDWCQSLGSTSTTVSAIADKSDELVNKGIQEAIDRANKRAESNAKRVQKWTILPRDFSIPGGELGPTTKLMRPVVNKMYASTIDAFYDV